ncbi:P-loop containing nucleoside triphosphate hydrolase protein [Limtongia smithiae]|uniref:P-loop containing nucleoside triphosphate hydrolase protein n=1 Tax=Limtongia smithiae TaxID=1125753 RepID=UPI0034CFC6AA
MDALRCPAPVWSLDDFNLCFRQRYLQIFFPLLAIAVSGFLLFSDTAKKWWTESGRGYTQLAGSERRNPFADDSAGTALLDDDDDDGDDLQIYRLATADPSRVNGAYNESLDGDEPIPEGADGDDFKVIVVNPRGTGLRIALEEVFLMSEIVLHVLAILSLLWYAPAREDWEHYGFRALIGALFWVYTAFLVNLRLSKDSEFVPSHIWAHIFALYSYSWISALISFRSAVIHPYHWIIDTTSAVDFFLTTIILGFGLMMNTSHKPIYIESHHGYDPNLEPLAGIAAKMSFSWVDPIIWKGYFKILTIQDIWDLTESDRANKILKEFRRELKNASFLLGLIRYFKVQLIMGVSWSVFHSFFAFVPSIVVRIILEYIENPELTPRNVAWMYVALLLFSSFMNAMGNGQALWNGRQICIRIRAIVIGELYAKALRRKASAGPPPAEGEAAEAAIAAGEAPAEDTDIGGIINLMAVDAFKVGEIVAYMHFLVGGIVMIILSLVLLYRTLGTAALAGAFTMISILPAHYYVSKVFGQTQSDLMKATDKRVHKTNEVLSSIKIIKYFAWEARFYDNVNEAREEELKMLYKRFFIWAASSILWYGAPIMITLVTFGFYTQVLGLSMTTPVAFSALALFNLMRIPLDQLAEMFTNMLQSKTSIERIQEFLKETETEKYKQLVAQQNRTATSPTIGFENATFTWGSTGGHEFKLENLNIEFKLGALNLVAGPTGAGKTSLLMALLGEMSLVSGSVFLPGITVFGEECPVDPETGLSESVAYCAQQAWLLNDTVKNNILFGNSLNEARYKAAITACGLVRDFEILEGGDETEVGERGIALSGGQKQRISLARALYSPARYLLLDDCLSAVDSHTAVWIYENCIMGPMMFGRTVILVSHNVALTLTGAAHVIYMEKGMIVQQGKAEEIVNAGHFGEDELIRASASKAQSRDISRSQSVANLKKAVDIAHAVEVEAEAEIEAAAENFVAANGGTSTTTTSKDKKKYKLVLAEAQQTGTVKWSVYMVYLKALGSFWFWFFTALAFGVFQYLNVGQSWWIRVWAANMPAPDSIGATASRLANNQAISSIAMFSVAKVTAARDQIVVVKDVYMSSFSDRTTAFYLGVYGIYTVCYLVMCFLREGFVFLGSLHASRVLFEGLLHKVMRARPRFFDATPIGRIMNRFSKDMEITDQEVAPVFVSLAHAVLNIIVIVLIVTYIMPMFLIAAIIITVLFWFIVTFFLASSREIKRMEAVTRSPIYQHFGETLVGVTTIRAYGYEDRFLRENEERIDNNNRPFWSVWACNRWMSFRVDVAGSLVSFFAGIFVIMSIGKIDSGLAGLCMTYAVMFTDSLLWFVWLYSMNEMNMNSVERIDEYMYIEEEAPEVIQNSRPPHGWPAKGAISVENLSLRYAPGLPMVIRDVTFEVKPTYKIGIVGRTGAGKSTIASAFFRFLEAETGRIMIDGIDIAKIGLKDLRSSITIIPQDPTLFTGTIRSNLDPFDNYSDEEVFRSLARVHLIDAIPNPNEEESSLSVVERHKRRVIPFYDLSNPVAEGGNNLSQGQRQLMCLARSLLRSPKVILLDEATASIDYNTDAQIQETIREEFADTTIITIAHRLRSIIDYDMILVLDAGNVKEFDQPHTLLQKSDSIFRSMCENSGEMEQLEELALKSFTDKAAARNTQMS